MHCYRDIKLLERASKRERYIPFRLISSNLRSLNQQSNIINCKDLQVLATSSNSKLRNNLERLKKIRTHRSPQYYCVHNQHTRTISRRDQTAKNKAVVTVSGGWMGYLRFFLYGCIAVTLWTILGEL